MKILKTAKEFFDWRSKTTSFVGFVPTMGALHQGHLSLVNKSKEMCKNSVVSIFLNPAQFSPNEDLKSYPKTLENDIDLLKDLDVDVLFLPDEEEMYVNVKDVDIPPSSLFERLEGQSRPHFFYGVTKIVSKLFNVVDPTHVFFGEKDAQQLIIIKEMIAQMNYEIALVSCPTIRDKNGLALSSRNHYLSINEQLEASCFSRVLLKIKKAIDEGELSSKILKKQFKENLSKNKKIKLDYISIANKKTLNEIDVVAGNVLISAAVYFNDVRLIDNFTYQSST